MRGAMRKVLIALRQCRSGPTSGWPGAAALHAARYIRRRCVWRIGRCFAPPRFRVLGWKVGHPGKRLFRQLTFSEAAARVDALGLANIAGVGTQKRVQHRDIRRISTPDLTAERVGRPFANGCATLNLRMPAYYASTIGPERRAQLRKLFEFAKGLGVETIISVRRTPASLPTASTKLADEFGINVAHLRSLTQGDAGLLTSPKSLMRALDGRSKRLVRRSIPLAGSRGHKAAGRPWLCSRTG